jgi:hypothetical protein
MLLQFTPTQTFDSDEFRSQYLKGLTYKVRDGNTTLLAAVEQWVELGLVTIVKPDKVSLSQIDGEGKISE